MRKLYDPEDMPDDAYELRAERHRVQHVEGPDCECHDCMTDDYDMEEEP